MSDTTQTPAPAPAPNQTFTAQVPAPAPKPTFTEYLVGNIPNHLKVIAIVAVVAGAVIAFNMIRDLKAKLAAQEQITATLNQKFGKIGTAAVSQNSQAPQPQVTQQASDVFGYQVLSYMQQQGAQITKLTTAIGTTQVQVADLQSKLPQFTPQQQNTTNGQLSGYVLDESRPNGAPPVSSVSLFYDPSKRDPAQAFFGTKWTHNQEQFTAAVGDWTKAKDGGLSTTLKLTRTVSKPDPNDPTKLIAVGTEDIPITGSSTVYTPKGLLAGTQPVVPRWTLDLGLTKTVNVNAGSLNSVTSGVGIYGSLDYRVTNRYGVFMGTANNGLLGGISIRLDAK